jgi:hypothetical protein
MKHTPIASQDLFWLFCVQWPKQERDALTKLIRDSQTHSSWMPLFLNEIGVATDVDPALLQLTFLLWGPPLPLCAHTAATVLQACKHGSGPLSAFLPLGTGVHSGEFSIACTATVWHIVANACPIVPGHPKLHVGSVWPSETDVVSTTFVLCVGSHRPLPTPVVELLWETVDASLFLMIRS